jgi:hypothetical protein
LTSSRHAQNADQDKREEEVHQQPSAVSETDQHIFPGDVPNLTYHTYASPDLDQIQLVERVDDQEDPDEPQDDPGECVIFPEDQFRQPGDADVDKDTSHQEHYEPYNALIHFVQFTFRYWD